uniref:Uncharacterized protein n=1 Tax=Arundo donax TaxID=35708 RepID=A0A0A9FZ35_ARUDO
MWDMNYIGLHPAFHFCFTIFSVRKDYPICILCPSNRKWKRNYQFHNK